MSIPNPASLIQDSAMIELPVVEQLGIIPLELLHQYHCDNPHRRLLSLFGTVYDVTSSVQSYGPDGAYKEYAGHDVTLALGASQTEQKWLDQFVKMKEKWIKSAKGWRDFFALKYPVAGKIDKWDREDPETWPELSQDDLDDLEKGCVIM